MQAYVKWKLRINLKIRHEKRKIGNQFPVVLALVFLGLQNMIFDSSALSFFFKCIILPAYSAASDHMKKLFLQLQSSCFTANALKEQCAQWHTFPEIPFTGWYWISCLTCCSGLWLHLIQMDLCNMYFLV